MSATSFTPPSAPFVYVECDIPEGLTLAEFRRSRHANPDRRSISSRVRARFHHTRRDRSAGTP